MAQGKDVAQRAPQHQAEVGVYSIQIERMAGSLPRYRDGKSDW